MTPIASGLTWAAFDFGKVVTVTFTTGGEASVDAHNIDAAIEALCMLRLARATAKGPRKVPLTSRQLEAVAERGGIGWQTVRRYLLGNRVTHACRARVEAALRELGFGMEVRDG